MSKRGALLAGPVAVALLLSMGASSNRLVDRWENPDFEQRKFRKILVIGITDDRRARHGFEDLFVSHLRGKGIGGMTSYSVVPELGSVSNQKALLAILDDREVDGAITVRAVPLKKIGEQAWGEQWRITAESAITVRELIDETLPIEAMKSKKYGIEVALWEVESGKRIWAARTDPYTVKAMRKSTGGFVQMVMQAMGLAELI